MFESMVAVAGVGDLARGRGERGSLLSSATSPVQTEVLLDRRVLLDPVRPRPLLRKVSKRGVNARIESLLCGEENEADEVGELQPIARAVERDHFSIDDLAVREAPGQSEPRESDLLHPDWKSRHGAGRDERGQVRADEAEWEVLEMEPKQGREDAQV